MHSVESRKINKTRMLFWRKNWGDVSISPRGRNGFSVSWSCSLYKYNCYNNVVDWSRSIIHQCDVSSFFLASNPCRDVICLKGDFVPSFFEVIMHCDSDRECKGSYADANGNNSNIHCFSFHYLKGYLSRLRIVALLSYLFSD